MAGVTRRELLALVASRPIAYRDYSRCLPDYLAALAERAYRQRNAAHAALTTAPAITARQRWVRETFWRLAGGAPERTPLNARVTGAFERPGYRVEKIVYESLPRFHVPANLYVPTTGRPPYPGVLFQMGHSLNGKAADTYQRCCQALARLGYLVLAFDPMGQGERTYYPDSSGRRTRLGSADDEHTVPGRQMLLNGYTSTRMQTWDAVRSLDYLAAHPLVDPKRLASTGQSGGGTLTMMLAAVDDRLACAAVSMGNTENFACAGFNPPGSTDDAEQNFIGGADAGFDRWDLLYTLAPKPLLIGVSAKDFFGTYSPSYISNGWEEYQKLQRVYSVLGAADKLDWYESPLPHGLAYDSRLQIYNWFARWLKGEAQPITEEPPVSPEPDEVLDVAPSGNVVRSFGGYTPFAWNKEQLPRRAVQDIWLRPSLEARFTVLGRVPSRAAEIEAVEVASDEKVWVPAWLFLPKKEDASKPILVLIEPAGRNARWREGELYQELAARGITVCVPDVRGIGDLTPEVGRGAPRYTRPHNDEEHWAWASLMLGRPLVTQRVRDLLAVCAALRARAARKLILAAQGKMTVLATFAASLDPRIDALYLSGGLVSYRSIVETEAYSHPFANFYLSALAGDDLPQRLVKLAPRPVTLAGPVGAAGRPASLEQVPRAAHIQYRSTAGWSMEAFLDLAHLSTEPLAHPPAR